MPDNFGKTQDDDLMKVFLEVSENSPSPYVKIATMHAVLRAFGADFRNIDIKNPDDRFSEASAKGGAILFNYALPVPRIGAISLPGNGWLIGILAGPMDRAGASDPKRYRQGRVEFIAHFPNPLDPIPNGVLWKGDDPCPPVPAKELESSFAGKPSDSP